MYKARRITNEEYRGLYKVCNDMSRHSVDILIGYVRDRLSSETGNDPEWESMMENVSDIDDARIALRMPRALVKNVGLPTLLDVARDRDAKMDKLAASATLVACDPHCTDEERDGCGGAVRILGMTWSWLFGYGPDNRFAFPDECSVPMWVVGDNSSGKSAWQEVLLLLLFGSGIPSRTADETGAYDFVNSSCPSNQRAEGEVFVALGDNTRFALKRTWKFADESARNRLSMSCVLRDITQPNAPVLASKGNAFVKSWVARNIGTKEHFLRCVALTQYNDSDFFFDLEGRKQLETLMDDVGDDNIADKASSSLMVEMLKTYALGLNTLAKCAASARDSLVAASNEDVSNSFEDLAALHAEVTAAIENERVHVRDLRDAWHPTVRAAGLRDMPPLRVASDTLADLRDRADKAQAEEEEEEEEDCPDASLKDEKSTVARRRLQELGDQYGQLPYNASCNACRSMPWRVEMRSLHQELDRSAAQRGPRGSRRAESLASLRERIRMWESIEEVRTVHDEYVRAEDMLKKTCEKEAELILAMERKKAERENLHRIAQCDALVDFARRRSQVASKARAILSGYRCWVLEHQLMPRFIETVNTVLDCFPDNSLHVCMYKIAVSSDSEELFVPSWRVHHGAVTLHRCGGLERALLNCAARITLGRMSHSDRPTYCQVMMDEVLSACDEINRQKVPSFLRALMRRMDYRHVVYACHSVDADDAFCVVRIERDPDDGTSRIVFCDGACP